MKRMPRLAQVCLFQALVVLSAPNLVLGSNNNNRNRSPPRLSLEQRLQATAYEYTLLEEQIFQQQAYQSYQQQDFVFHQSHNTYPLSNWNGNHRFLENEQEDEQDNKDSEE